MVKSAPKKEEKVEVSESENSAPVVDRPKVEIVEADVPKQPVQSVPKQPSDPVTDATAPSEQEPAPPVKVSAGEKKTLEAETEESTKDASYAIPSIPQNAPLKIEEREEEVEVPAIEKRGKKIFVFGIVATLVVVLLTGIIAFYFTNQLKQKPAAPASEKVEATPTPKPDILNRQDWTFEVLNGTTIAGEAKRLAEKLEGLGYTVITTGNADKNDFEKTTIFVSEDRKEEAKLMLEDLKKELDITTLSKTVLTDSTASARIVVGSK